MKITPYARVGRSPLIKAVGLQKNFKEIYYTKTLELDRYASGCFSCPNYKNVEFCQMMAITSFTIAQIRFCVNFKLFRKPV